MGQDDQKSRRDILNTMKKHIVVIGGGLAGTSAAHRLSEYGHDVTIIERGNYLGGRIRTRTVGGEAIELGAGFHPEISGRENIYNNATIFGLTKKEIDELPSLQGLEAESGQCECMAQTQRFQQNEP